PMPNSAVKRRSADGSVGSPHVRVGHCQALKTVETLSAGWGFLRLCDIRQSFWLHERYNACRNLLLLIIPLSPVP
uniref:hypothetical protein n=1 Tax=Photorhabdus namnaonensis TaxID=1851568 RepID=UPI00196A02DF